MDRQAIDLLVSQLGSLNDNLQRIADSVAPKNDSNIFAGHRAFKAYLVSGCMRLRPVAAVDTVRLDELKGIDRIIKRLRENTAQFMAGLTCNNVLLYGPRGTGKSSAIKALLNEYADRGLRMIEMERDALGHIFEVAELVKERPEKYIVFCDDLAFEEDDGSYRRLKALLEGGLEMRPANLIICATSNRRHLMPERMEDNLPVYKDSELHAADTIEEKLSLSDRFGLRLGFWHFDINVYMQIVRNYAALRKIAVEPKRLETEALTWSLEHGSYSGRTARQFIDDFEGRLKTLNSNQAS